MKSVFCALAILIAVRSLAAAEPTPTLTSATRQLSEAASQPILPPLLPWSGKSQTLAVAKTDPWIHRKNAYVGFTPRLRLLMNDGNYIRLQERNNFREIRTVTIGNMPTYLSPTHHS